jgi:glycosyltransferase involved in cell wall biosynthesis
LATHSHVTSSPRVIFGLPAFNRADSLPETLESILGQTCRDFALVIVDDSTVAETGDVAARYRALDDRVIYERNVKRLGMVANWRRAFHRARELFPHAEFFAWVSDHDVWHPRWLDVLQAALDAHPEVVLAYPVALRTFKSSRPAVNRSFDTFGISDPGERLRLASLRMMAGNMIYGLFRANALEQAGVFRRLLIPDRQVLLELSLLGQFKQVPELLWYREIQTGFSLERQRAALFAGRAPLYTYLPTHLTHAATLVWDLVVRERGRPAIGRLEGLGHGTRQLWTSVQRERRTAAKLDSESPTGWLRSARASTRPRPAAGVSLDGLGPRNARL